MINGLRVLVLIFTLLLASGEIVEVLVFQPDGIARNDTLATYEGQLDINNTFASVTLCLRIKLYYLYSSKAFFFVLMRTFIDHSIRCEISLDSVRPNFGNWALLHLLSKVLETFRWYHMCFSYDAAKSLHNTYLNGKKVYSIAQNIMRNMSGHTAYIGQNKFKHESLSGEVTQLNIWTEVISEDRIFSMANCQSNENGNYLSWNLGWKLQNIESYNIEYQKLCQVKEDYVYGFKNIFYQEAYYLCDALGSNLPMPDSLNETRRIVSVAEEKWPNTSYSCKYDFYSSFNDIEKEGLWVTYFDNEPFKGNIPFINSEPNGLHYENCAQFYESGYYDGDCESASGCAFCEFREKIIYSLRGACQTELRNIYFLSEQNELDNLAFRSYGKYQITKNDGIWKWIDTSNNNLLIAEMQVSEYNYPMGRRTWSLFEEICDQSTGAKDITLTSCKMDEFTCNDGKCISISNRCDMKYDCYDRSDEKNCELIDFPIDYKRDLPPRGNSRANNILCITLKASIESVSVDTELMEIRISFILELLWNDNRLKFINLKESSSLNGVTRDVFQKLWLPFIGFMNTVGNAFSEADREAFMFVSKLDNSSTFDDSKSQETYLFSGAQNPIVIVRRYMSTFYCKFDLVLYPFDEQSCGMVFQILNAPKDFLMFDRNNTMAENIDSSMLLEYEIGTLSVQHVEHQVYSRVKVIVPLKRRAGFAILNIYIPSLCFVTITYLTLFFRTEIFDVRVMGSLTTLLVVATLLNQVSTFLPKTSYLKAVDIWLLFCTSLIFLIIVFHVFIDIVSQNSDEDERKEAWVVSLKRSEKIKENDQKAIKKLKNKESVRKLILISRIVVISIFVLFNVIYWSVILL